METKTESAFIRNVLLASVITAVLAAYPCSAYLNRVQIYSVIAGYCISLINAMIGYRMNEMAFQKSVKGFMVLVFGGMGIRLMIMGIALVLVIYYANIDSIYLLSSVFIFYIIFVSLEILYLHKKQITVKKTGSAAAEK